jgi:gliding motility-associated-like protein
VNYIHRLILFLLVYSFHLSGKSQIIDTAFVGSERNYGSIGPPNTTYIWGVDNALIVSDPTLPTISVLWNEPLGLRPIWMIASNEIGCLSDTIKAFVYVMEFDTFYLPNAFTPDGDGLNDVFLPIVSEKNMSSYSLTIYNKWGATVFERTLPTMGWDGNYLGAPCDNGVYVWQLNVGKTIGKGWHKKGTLTIIR